MRVPTPEQFAGAEFLASRRTALLADEPGFGKTAQAVMACTQVGARKVLVVTTASARTHWCREFQLWSWEPYSASAIFGVGHQPNGAIENSEVVVISWSLITREPFAAALHAQRWHALILDESHYAANMVTADGAAVARTKAALGVGGLASKAERVWCLSGTPIPNTPDDIYPTLRALAPALLRADPVHGWPDVTQYERFVGRYCITKREKVGWFRERVKHIGGQNLEELNARLAPFMLRRTLKDLPPLRASVYALDVPDAAVGTGLADEDALAEAILDAARAGDTAALDMHMGPLRRLTGMIKAEPCIDLIQQEQPDQLVVFYWHRSVGDALERGLVNFHPVRVDGETDARTRANMVDAFQAGRARVFLAQIQAASEAITLTAANKALFVEASFTPSHMHQAVRRIYRKGQTRPCQVRVAALSGSIDEALMRVVTEKTLDIRTIMETAE